MGYCTVDKEYSSRKNISFVNLNWFMDQFIDVEMKFRTKMDWGFTPWAGWDPCLNVPEGLNNQFGWMFGWGHLEWHVDMHMIKYGDDVMGLIASPNSAYTCAYLCFCDEHRQRILNTCPWYEWDFVLTFRVDIAKEPRFMELLEKALRNEKWFDEQESTWSNVKVNVSKNTNLFPGD